AGERPTNVRWCMLALLMAFAALAHFNRISISVAGTEHIMDEYSLDENQMGNVYSAYLFVYTLCMLPGGWLIDRFGPKAALMLLGFGSAILVPLTGLTSLATSGAILLALCVVRGLLGVVSTPMHPGAARAVSFWMPIQERGVSNGLVTAAAVGGIAVTYIVFGALMDLFGWPGAFLVSGVATLALTLVWTFVATDRPFQHSLVNHAERELIAAGDPARAAHTFAAANPGEMEAGAGTATAGQQGGLIGWILRNRSLVLLSLSYAAYSYYQYLFFYWIQYYFDKIMQLGTEDGRFYATLPNLAMAVGMVSGGWVSDRIQARYGGWFGRAATPFVGMIAGSLLLLAGLARSDLGWVATCFTLSMGCLGLAESSFWVAGTALGRGRGGFSGAFLNTVGNAGGILGTRLSPLFSQYIGWQGGLCLASFVCLVGAALWWWIDPDERSGE
ncbi:MAG: MFS transporter, partial [Planctomycetaceae bacterium]